MFSASASSPRPRSARPTNRKHRLGKLAYIIEGAREIASIHAVPLELEADGVRFDLRSLMVLVFNGETAGGFRLARRSSIRDGLLDCILLEKRTFLRSAMAMGRYLLGGNPKIVHRLQARRLEIRSTVAEPTDVDGQKGADFPLHIECLPGGLRVVCPPSGERLVRRGVRCAMRFRLRTERLPGVSRVRSRTGDFPGGRGRFASGIFGFPVESCIFVRKDLDTWRRTAKRRRRRPAAGAKDCTKSPFRGSKRK